MDELYGELRTSYIFVFPPINVVKSDMGAVVFLIENVDGVEMGFLPLIFWTISFGYYQK